jgi:hypothetical protein
MLQAQAYAERGRAQAEAQAQAQAQARAVAQAQRALMDKIRQFQEKAAQEAAAKSQGPQLPVVPPPKTIEQALAPIQAAVAQKVAQAQMAASGSQAVQKAVNKVMPPWSPYSPGMPSFVPKTTGKKTAEQALAPVQAAVAQKVAQSKMQALEADRGIAYKFEVKPGWQVFDRNAQGEVITYKDPVTKDIYYTPANYKWKLGWEGAKYIPEGGTFTDPDYGKNIWGGNENFTYITENQGPGLGHYYIKNTEMGIPIGNIMLTPEQYKKFMSLEGNAQVDYGENLGIFKAGSEAIEVGGEKRVITGEQAKELRESYEARRNFETALKSSEPELYKTYRAEYLKTRDYEKAYQTVFDEKYITIDNQAMLRKDFNELPKKYQDFAKNKGFDKLFNRLESEEWYYNKYEAPKEAQIAATMKGLERFKDDDGNFNLIGYLDSLRVKNVRYKTKTGWKDLGPLEGIENTPEYKNNRIGFWSSARVETKSLNWQREAGKLKNAGFDNEAVDTAIYQAKLDPVRRFWQGSTPWSEQKGETATVKGGLTMAADWLIPFVYTARHWNELTPGQKGLYLGLDAIFTVFPIYKGASIAAREVAGTATRAGVMAAAARGAARAAVGVAAGPLEVVLHPVGAAKATMRDARELAENIANPKKIPSMSIYTSTHDVKLSVTKDLTATQAMKIRDKLMEAAVRGEKIFVEIDGVTVELRRSPLMQELKGSMAHATPQGNIFTSLLKVTNKPGMPAKEQGLFFAHDPVPGFATASAHGAGGSQPTIFIISQETASRTVSSKKIYNSPFGPVAEMERKLPVGEELKEVGQKLYTRLGLEGTRVEIWLEKGMKLNNRQIAKLKIMGLVEAIKAPFEPAMKISNFKGWLTYGETENLANILNRAGARNQARNLLRAGRLAEVGYRSPASLLRASTMSRNYINRTKTEADRIRMATRASRRADVSRERTGIPRYEVTRLRRSGVSVVRSIDGERMPTISRLERARMTVERPRAEVTGRVERINRSETDRITTRADIERGEIERQDMVDRGQLRRAERKGRDERIDRSEIPRIDRGSDIPPGTPEPKRRPDAKTGDEEKRNYLAKVRGFIAEKRGTLKKLGDVWHIQYYPYENEDRFLLFGRPPRDAKPVYGEGSLDKSAVLLWGVPPEKPIVHKQGSFVDVVTARGKDISVKTYQYDDWKRVAGKSATSKDKIMKDNITARENARLTRRMRNIDKGPNMVDSGDGTLFNPKTGRGKLKFVG